MTGAVEQGPAEEEDALPGDGRDLLQPRDRVLVAGGLMAVQHGREQDGIVGDDDQGEQPAALVAELDIEIGAAGRALLAGDLGDGRAQLVISLDAVLRPVDVALQLRVADVLQRVEAAHQLVVFEDGPAGPVLGRQGAQLADQRGLARLLERQGGDDAVDDVLFGRDQAAVDLAGRRQQERCSAVDVAGAEEMGDLGLSSVLQFSVKVGFETSLIGLPCASFRRG